MRSLLGGIALAIIFGATVLFLLVLVGPQSANAAMCPDGSYVSGSTCTLCPNGSYVGGGRCVLQPDGTYTGGYGGSPVPGPQFNIYPALSVQGPLDNALKLQRLKNARTQNRLLQQQLQQQRQRAVRGILIGVRTKADQALIEATTAPIGKTITWNNPNTGNYGTITPIREGTKNTGEYCREFRQTAGGTKQAYGVACRQGNGSWRME